LSAPRNVLAPLPHGTHDISEDFHMRITRLSLVTAALTLAACADATGPRLTPADASLSKLGSAGATVVGGVFTQTNSSTGNAIVAYARHADGSLSYLGSYPTSGRGTAPAIGLGSQGAVVLAPNDRFLFAVNSGSDEISSFAVDKDGLAFVSKVGSGGQRPVSIAATEHLLYALNAAGNTTLAGFRIGKDGSLTPVPSWTRTLGAGVGAATSFTIDRDGNLTKASGPVATNQLAPCWVVLTKNGRFAYTANAQSGSVSAFAVGRDGSLSLVTHADGSPAGITGMNTGPLDMDVSRNSRFLYVVEGRTGNIMGFEIRSDGLLSPMPDALAPITGGGRGGLAAY
jgi:6-phosphogluconolactonase